jgi:hypothetical protein
MKTSNQKATELIAQMLRENTGRALCDSGDYYGRNWQKNRAKMLADFEADPEIKWEVSDYTPKDGEKVFEIIYTVSLFHYLKSFLELDEQCDAYNAVPCENWDSDIAYGVSTEGQEWLEMRGATVGTAVNVYNHENNLSQVIQYSEVEIDGDYYVLLQIHGGCDVRGGYTNAKLFRFQDQREGHDYFGYDPDVTLVVTPAESEDLAFDNYGGREWIDTEGRGVSRDTISDALAQAKNPETTVKMYVQFGH